MIKRNEIEGTVTISIVDFDELTTNKEKNIAKLNEEKTEFELMRERFIHGLTSFVLPYYGLPYENGTLWLKENEAIEEMQKSYEHKLKGVQEYTENLIRKKSYFELIKWKYNENS